MGTFADTTVDAGRTCDFLKALTNPSRLLILCQLAMGERSVGELEGLLGLRQPTLSQQLARLREDQLVEARRHGKMVYDRLASHEARQAIELLCELFCAPDARTGPTAEALRMADGRGIERPRSP